MSCRRFAASMRSNLRSSPVCDAETFARNMERIYSTIA